MFAMLCGALLLAAPAVGADTNVVDVDPPDVEVVDQNGRKARFVSEVIGDNLAVITFTYTSCTTVCPTLNGIFKKLQSDLGEDLGRGTVLLTVSVEPGTDIPARLEHHAEKLGAKPGWSFLTGDQAEVNRLLKSVGVYAPNVEEHAPTVFVVDGSRGVWTRLYGFPTPDTITGVLDGYAQYAKAAEADRP
jgi:protein SCO1/2